MKTTAKFFIASIIIVASAIVIYAIIVLAKYILRNTTANSSDKKYINLEMSESFYNKESCLHKAEEILESSLITGMSVKQLAAEIYTHAFVYYNFEILPEVIRNISFAQKVFNSTANGIDLEDNGDSLPRRACYAVIWFIG